MKYEKYVPVLMTERQHKALLEIAKEEGLYNNENGPNASAAVRHLIDKHMEKNSD